VHECDASILNRSSANWTIRRNYSLQFLPHARHVLSIVGRRKGNTDISKHQLLLLLSYFQKGYITKIISGLHQHAQSIQAKDSKSIAFRSASLVNERSKTWSYRRIKIHDPSFLHPLIMPAPPVWRFNHPTHPQAARSTRPAQSQSTHPHPASHSSQPPNTSSQHL
jgi:hypothetical protein